MTQSRHEPFEELISASLRHGDLTPEERDRLNRHLDTCEQCRATLAAFADQRRIVAGVRHVPPPRDLNARVRAGIESGAFAPLPWWRRPVVMFAGVGGGMAVAAGALLAIVLLNGPQSGPPVGQASPTSSAAVAIPSATLLPTLPPPSVAASAEPSTEPVPSTEPTPVPSPEPAVFVAVTGPADNQAMTVRDGTTGDTIVEASPPPGEPIAAELSPDGTWLAYVAAHGESGINDILVMRVAAGDGPKRVGETTSIGTQIAGSPFVDVLAWSPDGRYLAFTSGQPTGTGTDAFVLDVATWMSYRLTETERSYVASWVPTQPGEAPLLWVSTAWETPRSDLLVMDEELLELGGIDPLDPDRVSAENVFMPRVSPNGAFVMFWSGRMERVGEEWLFTEGGAPWLAQNTSDGQGGYEFTSARPLFSDVSVGRDAFTSAAFTWGGDSDAYAVWDVAWTGLPQGEDGAYPDPARVYFGHATDPRGLTQFHAIDAADLPADTFVVDVKVAPTGNHLVITAAYPRAGVLDPPRADLLLVERNTGSVADAVTEIEPDAEGWFGPAAFGGGD